MFLNDFNVEFTILLHTVSNDHFNFYCSQVATVSKAKKNCRCFCHELYLNYNSQTVKTTHNIFISRMKIFLNMRTPVLRCFYFNNFLWSKFTRCKAVPTFLFTLICIAKQKMVGWASKLNTFWKYTVLQVVKLYTVVKEFWKTDISDCSPSSEWMCDSLVSV